MSLKTISDDTKYPHIFKGTYWGSLYSIYGYGITETQRAKNIQTPIILNRNKFVEYFDIQNYTSKDKRLVEYRNDIARKVGKYRLDHPESYTTKSGEIVVVTSPYFKWKVDPESVGWIEIKPLYTIHAYTYMTMLCEIPRSSKIPLVQVSLELIKHRAADLLIKQDSIDCLNTQ